MSGNKSGFASMAKLGIILALYSAVAGVGLAFVYDGTAKIIAQRQQEDLEHALQDLFNDADSFKPITDIRIPAPGTGEPQVIIEGEDNNPNNTGAFVAMKNGQIIGVALRTSRASYSGPIKILTGVGADGKIKGVMILENTDTPGLGANASSTQYYVDRAKGIHFYEQFTGKNVSDPFVPKQDVIVITAATITSRAVASSVKAAGEAASAWLLLNASSQGGSR
jgi:electron transport complex protein RnfG